MTAVKTRKEFWNHMVEKYPDFVNVVKEGPHVVLHLRSSVTNKVMACATHIRAYDWGSLQDWERVIELKFREINHVYGA